MNATAIPSIVDNTLQTSNDIMTVKDEVLPTEAVVPFAATTTTAENDKDRDTVKDDEKDETQTEEDATPNETEKEESALQKDVEVNLPNDETFQEMTTENDNEANPNNPHDDSTTHDPDAEAAAAFLAAASFTTQEPTIAQETATLEPHDPDKNEAEPKVSEPQDSSTVDNDSKDADNNDTDNNDKLGKTADILEMNVPSENGVDQSVEPEVTEDPESVVQHPANIPYGEDNKTNEAIPNEEGEAYVENKELATMEMESASEMDTMNKTVAVESHNKTITEHMASEDSTTTEKRDDGTSVTMDDHSPKATVLESHSVSPESDQSLTIDSECRNVKTGEPSEREHTESGNHIIAPSSETSDLMGSGIADASLSNDTLTESSSENVNHTPKTESAVEEMESKEDSFLLVLVSLQSLDRQVVANQEKIKVALAGIGMGYQTLDGADPANKERRNELFEISGLRAQYPQFFWVHGSQTTFWGDWEKFEMANDTGSIPSEWLSGLATGGISDCSKTNEFKSETASRDPVVKVTDKSVKIQVALPETIESHVLMLISLQSHDREVSTRQKKAMTVMDTKEIKYKTLDGANPANKTRRNELFFQSGIRTTYPQFFIVEEDGSTSFWGDWDRFEEENESGQISESLGGIEGSATTKNDSKETSENRVLVLISQQSLDREVRTNQQKATSILDANEVNYITFDGADPTNKTQRNELFFLSGLRAQYPQFFVQANGTDTKFWGDWEKFQRANEESSIPHEFQDFLRVKGKEPKLDCVNEKTVGSVSMKGDQTDAVVSESEPRENGHTPVHVSDSTKKSSAPQESASQSQSAPSKMSPKHHGRIALTPEMWKNMNCPM